MISPHAAAVEQLLHEVAGAAPAPPALTALVIRMQSGERWHLDPLEDLRAPDGRLINLEEAAELLSEGLAPWLEIRRTWGPPLEEWETEEDAPAVCRIRLRSHHVEATTLVWDR